MGHHYHTVLGGPLWCTRAWWARVLCEVPEPTKLGYSIVGHQVPCGSGGPLNYYFFFFFFTIVGLVRRNFFFLIFFFIYTMCFSQRVFIYFLFPIVGLLKTFFINSICFNFFFFIYTICNDVEANVFLFLF